MIDWLEFCQEAKHARRYSLLSGTLTAGESTSPLKDLHAVSEAIRETQLIHKIPAGFRIWRGRMRETPRLPHYTASTVGSTPHHRATSNRLSPAGTSMFYGSADPRTAAAEISAHDRRPFAAVAAFQFTRTATVIDLVRFHKKLHDIRHALRSPPAWTLEFIQAFADGISEPVKRDGREVLEYIPTQMITEYFRHLSPLRVDGIRFHSAQNRGTNYVIFVGPEGCADFGKLSPQTLLWHVPAMTLMLSRTGDPVQSS